MLSKRPTRTVGHRAGLTQGALRKLNGMGLTSLSA